MLKKITLYLLFTFLSGCDMKIPSTNTECETNTSLPSNLTWAIVDMQKLQKTVVEIVKKEEPLPEEISQQMDNNNSYQIQQEIAEHLKEERKKCLTNAPQKPQTKNIEAIVSADDNSVINISGYDEQCLRNVGNDQTMVELREKLKKINDVHVKKNKYEENIRKKVSKTMESLLAAYSEKHKYQLIIASRQDEILYNQNKTVLDVTAAVIDYLLKNKPKIEDSDREADEQ